MPMHTRNQRKYPGWGIAVGLLAGFVLWTVLLCLVDVQPIGPGASRVGFAALNGLFHHLTGVNMTLYTITDWLGILPLAVVAGFGILGLVQWIRRRSIRRVDRSLLVLGGFYLVVLAVFVLFEVLAINYRPILINGVMEASYPSSTTMLAMCVLPTAAFQLHDRIRHAALRTGVVSILWALTIFMVVCRLLSGVHWLTDILGGGLFGAGMVLGYRALTRE